MLAVENDYIIRGVQGELYPCKPDIFEATYEPWTKCAPEQDIHVTPHQGCVMR
jgi:hypothetical protein